MSSGVALAVRRVERIGAAAVIMSAIGLTALGWQTITAEAHWAIQLISLPLGAAVGFGLVKAAFALDAWLGRRL